MKHVLSAETTAITERKSWTSLRWRVLRQRAGLGLLVLLFLAVILVPLWWIIESSFTPRPELFKIPISYFPAHPTLENYAKLFTALNLARLAFNSVFLAVVSSVVACGLSFLAAYGFARLRLRGLDAVLVVFLVTAMLPQMSTVVPLYRFFQHLHLLNTLQGLLILYTSAWLPMTIFIFVSFFRQFPVEIEEAAQVDGASAWQVISRVVFPVAWPVVATMFLINFIAAWNELIYPLIFSVSDQGKTLTVAITQVSSVNNIYMQPWEDISAMGVIMIAPVIVFVAVFQRRIVSGLTAGAVK